MPDHDTPDHDAPDAKATATDALVECWFFECFHGSAVARSTEAWNVAHAAKEELKRRLAAPARPKTA